MHTGTRNIIKCKFKPISAHLQQEVEEDGHSSIEGEAPHSRHGGHSSQQEGSRLREGGEEQAGGHLTNAPTNQLLHADSGQVTFVVLGKLACFSL